MAMYIAAAKPRKELTPAIEKLIEKQTDTLKKIKNDLSEYIEKQDYRFSSEERAATGRYIGESLSKVVGRRGIERTLMKILKAKESGSS
jgi:tRNA uridine 5-carbamoylmethylation protein Kti12